MVQEAEKFKADDEKIKNRVEAKNKLENYCYNVKSTVLGEEKMKTALGADRETVEKTVDETLKWVDEHSDSSAEEFEAKLKEVEGVLMPLIAKAYQSNMPANQTSETSEYQGPQVDVD
jgi:L1 cell adhesion molecule like protein